MRISTLQWPAISAGVVLISAYARPSTWRQKFNTRKATANNMNFQSLTPNSKLFKLLLRMKRSASRAHYFLPVKTIVVITVILSVIVFLTTSAFKENNGAADVAGYKIFSTDSTESARAFLQVYKVL